MGLVLNVSIREVPFEKIEKKIRKCKFGFLGSITSGGRPHVAGVMYAVSPPGDDLALYIITSVDTKKAKNIRDNPNVTFAIPIPHHIIRFAPDFNIQFQGKAEILLFNDPKAQEAMKQRRLMKRILKNYPLDTKSEIFIHLSPDKKIHGFGLGIPFFKLIKDITGQGQFYSLIP